MNRHIQGILILLLLSAIFGCGEGATSGDPLGTDSITVIAEPASVNAGDDSIITATVVRLDDKIPATDRLVSFRISTNNSGGMFKSMSDKVDGQNKARAVYSTGSNSPANVVTDTIQVSLSNGASAAVVITREKSTMAAFSITVSAADPPILTHATGNSVVTATVKNNFGNPASGVKVTFTVTGIAGTVHPAEATTDGSGNAQTVYTGVAGTLKGQTSAVTASITVDGSKYDDSTIITYP
jgi:hypothetical protein